MRLAIRRAKSDDEQLGVKEGDLLLVNLNYDYDNEKVEVLTVLKRGSCPNMSEYKSSLTKVTGKQLREYLEGE